MNTRAMDPTTIPAARRLSNQQIIEEVKRLARDERGTMASLIAHLSVLDERQLYLEEGCSSTYAYCFKILHLSEHATYGRIEAARAARKYPIILQLLEDGSINLTTVTLLARYLTPENHRAVLEAAKHKRRYRVEQLVAALRPRPAVPDTIRKLPQPPSPPSPMATMDATISSSSEDSAHNGSTESEAAGDASGPPPLTLLSPPASLSPAPSSPACRPTVEALAPDCYKIQFTATGETVEKLRRLQDLLRHQIPNGDLGKIMDRAVTALLEQVTRQKIGLTDRPRSERVPEGETAINEPTAEVRSTRKQEIAAASRHIPAAVRRAVWNRDGGQCVFVGSNGHRCNERGFLEFHHKVPYCLGGEATVENIELRCRAHNGYEFERVSMSWKDGNVRELGSNRVGLKWNSDLFETRESASWPLRC